MANLDYSGGYDPDIYWQDRKRREEESAAERARLNSLTNDAWEERERAFKEANDRYHAVFLNALKQVKEEKLGLTKP